MGKHSAARPKPARCRRLLAAAVVTLLACASAVALASGPASASLGSSVTITGHGYGHGRGMGQYGAYGYATIYSWNYTQILSHYYGGTTLVARNYGNLRVDLSDLDGDGSVTVTSANSFTAGGVVVAGGTAARLTYVAPGSFKVQTSKTCTGTFGAAKAVKSGTLTSRVATPASVAAMLSVCSTGHVYRGSLSLVYGDGATHVVNLVAMEDYLRGVVPRESPASWGDAAGGKGIAALEAQAVAARSYASVQHRYAWADICDSQNCQVYGGAGLNGSSIEDARTNTAVAKTAGKVLVKGTAIVSAEYSSSTGGWSAGGTFPAVEDLGDVASPDHDWTVTVPAADIGADFGIGTLTSAVLHRNGLGADGGRVLTADLTGSSGSTTVTGDDFASELGLLSNWFTVVNPAPPTPTLILTNELNATPRVDVRQPFGNLGDHPFACDFNRDGTDTGGVYRSSTATFYYRNSLATGTAFKTVRLGAPGDLPVCGDWNGDGYDSVGVYRQSNATFYLIDSNNRRPTTPVITVKLGNSKMLPVAGDFDGDHKATPGVYDRATSQFYLVNSLKPGAPRLSYQYGSPGNLPVVGDWDGNGTDTLGVQQGGVRFALSNRLGAGSSVRLNYGRVGDLPLAGDFDHSGHDSVGVARGYIDIP